MAGEMGMTTLTDQAREELVAIYRRIHEYRDWQHITIINSDDGIIALHQKDAFDHHGETHDRQWHPWTIKAFVDEMREYAEVYEGQVERIAEWERKWLAGDTGGGG